VLLGLQALYLQGLQSFLSAFQILQIRNILYGKGRITSYQEVRHWIIP
jgi:hypothetical protein